MLYMIFFCKGNIYFSILQKTLKNLELSDIFRNFVHYN